MKEMNNSGAWLLEIPAYEGGIFSDALYNIGYGKNIQKDSEISRMQIVRQTSAEQFLSYTEKLVRAGYEKIFENQIGENHYAQFLAPEGTVYAYHIGAFSEARVIYDKVSTPIDAFAYGETGESRNTTAVYQYAMMYDPLGFGPGDACDGKYTNNGMFYVYRLADNGIVLVDGGWIPQATEHATQALVEFLYEISQTPEEEKLRVAAVIITHPHGDHKQFVEMLIRHHSERINIERFIYNIASYDLIAGCNDSFPAFGALVQEKYPDAMFLKPHTGQKFTLSDMQFEVIYTHEDMVLADNACLSIGECNNTSVVWKLTVRGKTFMMLADLGTAVDYRPYRNELCRLENRILGSYRNAEGKYPQLKADVVQVAHHSANDRIYNYYHVIGARYALIPQQDFSYTEMQYAYHYYARVADQVRTAGAERLLYAGRMIHCLEVDRNGVLHLSNEPIRGADEGYEEYLKAGHPFDSEDPNHRYFGMLHSDFVRDLEKMK